MSNPRPVHVAGHSLRYGVRVPAKSGVLNAKKMSFDLAYLGATLVGNILESCDSKPRVLLSDPIVATTIDECYRTWNLVWHPSAQDVTPSTLRVRSIDELVCPPHFKPWQPLEIYGINPVFVSRHEPIVYIVIDATYFDVDCRKHLSVESTKFLIVNIICSGGPPHDKEHFLDYIKNLGMRNPNSVVLMTDRFLTAMDLTITDDRSWEEFADNCVDQFLSPPDGDTLPRKLAESLCTFEHILVRHLSCAVVHLEPKKLKPLCRLHYHQDPESQFQSAPGFLQGFSDAMGASLAQSLAEDLNGIDAGVRLGIARCARYSVEGLFDASKSVYDLKRVAQLSYAADMKKVSTIELPNPAGELRKRSWSVLDQLLWQSSPVDTSKRATELGITIVTKGVDKARATIPFPIVRFGKLMLVDRPGFEAVNEIRSAMRRYLDGFRTAAQFPKPLCLAIFGRPGGGKGFAVKEIAKALDSEYFDKNQILEVNLSQISRTDELEWVFHQVRDSVNRSVVPLVFFDEFDSDRESQPFGWQKTFLAPMQDGKFGVPPNVIDFRSGIFVFVGGLNTSFDMFHSRARNREFIEAKGPDFVSRLVRHLNVLGMTKDSPDEEYSYIIRRAVMIRETLWRLQPGIFREGPDGDAAIAEDVCRALLTVPEYRHGVRSLEAILSTSRMPPERARFHWGTLPPRTQLDMFVDVAAFQRSSQ